MDVPEPVCRQLAGKGGPVEPRQATRAGVRPDIGYLTDLVRAQELDELRELVRRVPDGEDLRQAITAPVYCHGRASAKPVPTRTLPARKMMTARYA
jgi:hypothetical protein